MIVTTRRNIPWTTHVYVDSKHASDIIAYGHSTDDMWHAHPILVVEPIRKFATEAEAVAWVAEQYEEFMARMDRT